MSLASLESIALPVPERSTATQDVLHGMSFTAPAGKLTALVGPSGAGKTTTTHLVSRLYDPREGVVRVGGYDIAGLTLNSLHEAVGVEADCNEAIYNLGLVNLKVNNLQEAQQAFDKLHTSLASLPESLFQLGAIYERGGSPEDLENAVKTFQMLLNKVPNDPNLCCKLGQIYEKMQDDNAACHWHSEAHRHFPVNLNVTSWLGVWYVKREMYDQAIEYFERAALVQPSEVKWQLMVTSCYRRLGDFYKALELYQKVGLFLLALADAH